MSTEFEVADGRAVDLGMGYQLIAPGYRGTGLALEAADFRPGTRSSGRSSDYIDSTFADALARADMREEQTITVELRQDPSGQPTRSAAHGEGMMLVAPDMGEQWGQVAIVTDESGAVIGIAVASLESDNNISFAIPASAITSLPEVDLQPVELAMMAYGSSAAPPTGQQSSPGSARTVPTANGAAFRGNPFGAPCGEVGGGIRIAHRESPGVRLRRRAGLRPGGGRSAAGSSRGAGGGGKTIAASGGCFIPPRSYIERR